MPSPRSPRSLLSAALQPAPLFLLFLAAYLAILGGAWLPQPGTGGELLGHAAKTEAILRLLGTGHLAWFPDYLGGSPSATLLSFALSVPVFAPALRLFADPVVAMKLTALLLLALGGLAAFAFGRRLARDGWSGFAVGSAYLLAPQLLLRVGWQEHLTIALVIPLVPLAFLALLRVAERGTPWDAILLGVVYSATLLAWSKMGATLALPLAIFAAWLFVSRPEDRAALLRGAMWAIPVVLLLGVLPLLPLLRERAFMTVFELDPFAQWQAAYSVKTATSWFDRAGELFLPLPPNLRIDRGGYYLGLVGIAAVAGTLLLTWRRNRHRPEIAAIRVFLLIALAMFWVSFGPRSVIQGHFEFLDHAGKFADAGIPLHWLTLAAPGLVLFWCLPPARWRLPAFFALYALYLFLPAFRLLEHLPLFADLRAPDSFWILNGTFAWAVASALAVVFVLRDRVIARFRPLVATAVLAAAAFDLSPYLEYFQRGALGPELFSRYDEAARELRDRPDRVLVVSGRYFSLDLPTRAGRPLSTEALNRYLMPATTARLQTAARLSAADMLTYLSLAGISDVLVERGDPDVPEAAQQWFRALLPVRYENDAFSILHHEGSLYPGFFAASAVPAATGYQESIEALAFARTHHLAITAPESDLSLDHLPGLQTPAAAKSTPAPPFAVRPLASPRSPGHVSLATPGQDGWIVLGESWHPDWRATIDGVPALVYRGAGAFPAVPVRANQRLVEFRFTPPAWVPASLAASALAWLAALTLLAIAPLLPKNLTQPSTQKIQNPKSKIQNSPRPPITRPLALIPTYDEAASIDALLDRILDTQPNLEILVVDDASPDGTAARVRAHPAHGTRVHLLERSGKLGLGSAYRAGFDWALARGHDACLEIDADFSHDPADIPRLLAALEAGADAAIGSRYLDGVRVINWPEHRLMLSAGAARYVRLLTGLPLTDPTSGFKALRADALRRLDRTQLRADGYGFQVELHWLLWMDGCHLTEVPIVFTERRAGQTKMTLGIAVEAAARVLQLAAKNPARRPRPAA